MLSVAGNVVGHPLLPLLLPPPPISHALRSFSTNTFARHGHTHASPYQGSVPTFISLMVFDRVGGVSTMVGGGVLAGAGYTLTYFALQDQWSVYGWVMPSLSAISLAGTTAQRRGSVCRHARAHPGAHRVHLRFELRFELCRARPRPGQDLGKLRESSRRFCPLCTAPALCMPFLCAGAVNLILQFHGTLPPSPLQTPSPFSLSGRALLNATAMVIFAQRAQIQHHNPCAGPPWAALPLHGHPAGLMQRNEAGAAHQVADQGAARPALRCRRRYHLAAARPPRQDPGPRPRQGRAGDHCTAQPDLTVTTARPWAELAPYPAHATPSRAIRAYAAARLFYGCFYMLHLSGNARRDSHFTGSAIVQTRIFSVRSTQYAVPWDRERAAIGKIVRGFGVNEGGANYPLRPSK